MFIALGKAKTESPQSACSYLEKSFRSAQLVEFKLAVSSSC